MSLDSSTSAQASANERKIVRSEEHTSELQSQFHLVCRLLLQRAPLRFTFFPYTTLFRSNLDLLPAFDCGLGGEVRHTLVSFDVFGSAIGISAVINCIHANKDVAGFKHLSPGQRKREKNREIGRAHV